MTLRTRLALAAGLAVALAVAVAAVVVYFAVRSELRGEIDNSLRERASVASNVLRVAPAFEKRFEGRLDRAQKAGRVPHAGMRLPAPPDVQPPKFGGAPGLIQLVQEDGTFSAGVPGEAAVPVDERIQGVAAGTAGTLLMDKRVNGNHLRVLVRQAPEPGVALLVARPLDEVDGVLRRLLRILAAVVAGGAGLGIALGAVVARSALGPVRRFTERTEDLIHDPDPSHRLDVHGRDELGRLARSFNATLDALERSIDQQRSLVADASHELRTPLASVRTNVQVLARAHELPADERQAILHETETQLAELSALVGDVVELARGGERDEPREDVQLDELVQAVVERMPPGNGVRIETELRPSTVHGMPTAISRAASNLLDNAVKWSPPGGVVTVRVEAGELRVMDSGPGFDPVDLPYVFNRFYRADSARGMPGSGLGLAIVKQIAESHGGSARARNTRGGGALLTVTFPSANGTRPQA
jgi:two-component system, OmpR family, sensor histidine kinase MprB